MNAAAVHRVMHDYLIAAGWKREEPGSGWYVTPCANDMLRICEAVGLQFDTDGVDTRTEPAPALEKFDGPRMTHYPNGMVRLEFDSTYHREVKYGPFRLKRDDA